MYILNKVTKVKFTLVHIDVTQMIVVFDFLPCLLLVHVVSFQRFPPWLDIKDCPQQPSSTSMHGMSMMSSPWLIALLGNQTCQYSGPTACTTY